MPIEARLRPLIKLYGAMRGGANEIPYVEQRRTAEAMARRGRWLMMPKGPKMAREKDILVPVDGGQIRVRLYYPNAIGPHPRRRVVRRLAL
ncbi:MAG: hypothetical protein KDA95_02530 [Acidimicrobiales bacterium]|nr:hypothetical protein [Acidimicrobiales bacterium]